jgi:ribonuclease J
MQVTADLFGTPRPRVTPAWDSRSGPFAIGGFTVTPMLTDHSAFDAYMLLIEGFGRRILYTGDFRTHGRKRALVEQLVANPPADLDLLLMEGTNLRSTKPVIAEDALEKQFTDLARQTPRHLFVAWSAQNIDRTVTLYRAAKKSGRRLVIDLYTADVLARVAGGSRVPQPGWDHLEVIVTGGLMRRYEAGGRGDFVTAMARGGFGTSAKRLASGPPAIVMLRDALLRDYARGGLTLSTDDAYAFSNWRGYLDEAAEDTAWAKARSAGAVTGHLHTSGHASPDALSAFANAMRPHMLVPVHGEMWDDPGIALPIVRRLADGEAWEIV